MKNTIITILLIMLTVSGVKGQSTIAENQTQNKASKSDVMYLHDGTAINCTVFRVDNFVIIYTYNGEQTQQVISKYAVEKIVHSNSGRVEKISDKVNVSGSKDWDKVIILEDKSNITGLNKVGEIRGQSTNWSGFNNLNHRDYKAVKKIKMEAAEMGCQFILLESGLNGSYQSVRKGIAYKY